MFQKHYEISAPALHAARVILRNFDLVEKPNGRIRSTEKNLAILIDVCTGVHRVQAVMMSLVQQVPWMDKDALRTNLDQLREAIRLVELVTNRMPRFGETAYVPADTYTNASFEASRSQMEELNRVARAVAGARTVEEEQKVLRQAGILRAGHS